MPTPTTSDHLTGGLSISVPLSPNTTQPDDLPPELLRKIHDPTMLDSGQRPFIVNAWASTDLKDSYNTRMRASSLKNFAQDAARGVGVQNSHRVDEQSLGRTFDGRYAPPRGEQPGRAEVSLYIPPGLHVGSVSTDDLINGIRWGTSTDVSVGFYGGRTMCSLCGRDMLGNLAALLGLGKMASDDPDAPCSHIAGVKYPPSERRKGASSSGASGAPQVAVGEIEGAHIAELSFVFAAATPQAGVRSGEPSGDRLSPQFAKAAMLDELGLLDPSIATALEPRYRCKFEATRRVWTGADTAAAVTDEKPHISSPYDHLPPALIRRMSRA